MIIEPTNRREFLSAASILSLATLSGCASEASETDNSTGSNDYTAMLGAQLYTVRTLFETDPRATLEKLAKIGVKDCETAGMFEHNPSDIRLMLNDLGMVSRSAHIRLPALQDTAPFAEEIELAEVLGQDRLYLGWIPEDERSAERYRILADLLNARGEEAKAAGLKVGYHNHEFEFHDLGGETGYDILLERTDPDLVTFEVDFFWTADAGQDPLALFEKAQGRFSSCHIKDRNAQGEMVSVGTGEIDFKTLLPLAKNAGIERFYIEHDNPDDPIASVTRSFAHLTS